MLPEEEAGVQDTGKPPVFSGTVKGSAVVIFTEAGATVSLL